MRKPKKHTRNVLAWERRKRWHISRAYGKRYIIFRHHYELGYALVRILPKGFRFTREERQELIGDAPAQVQMESAAARHGIGHA